MTVSASSPEALARGLLTFVGMELPVDLDKVAKRIGLRKKYVNSTGFEGALVRIADRPRGIVAIRKAIVGDARKRFTYAHEIGHYVLPGHGVDVSVCAKKQMDVVRDNVGRMEIEANKFASELLMPSRAVGAIIDKYGVSFETCNFVARQFGASLTASAVKCVEASDKQAALVVSDEGVRKYFRRSDRWKYYIELGEELSPASLAKDLLTEGVSEKEGIVPGLAWTSVKRSPDLWEESILLSSYNRILTLLTVP
jgi:Zn-dependent peptidase ImmA (M78 family)